MNMINYHHLRKAYFISQFNSFSTFFLNNEIYSEGKLSHIFWVGNISKEIYKFFIK